MAQENPNEFFRRRLQPPKKASGQNSYTHPFSLPGELLLDVPSKSVDWKGKCFQYPVIYERVKSHFK